MDLQTASVVILYLNLIFELILITENLANEHFIFMDVFLPNHKQMQFRYRYSGA